MKTKDRICMLVAGLLLLTGQSLLADQIFLEASDDSWVNGWTGTADGNNYGANTTANLRYENATWGNNYALYTFDFSTLPANIEVTAVRMRFYTTTASWPATPTNFAPIAIFRNTEDWDESTVVFTNAPTYSATAAETLDHFGVTGNPVYFTGENTISNSAGWLEFESEGTVALVQGWADGTIDNYGISMMGTGDFLDSARLFLPRTKEAGETVRPEIVVDYIVVPTTTVIVEASDDSWVNGHSVNEAVNYGSDLSTSIRYENDTWGQNRSLFKFDLSALPANIEVASVSMRFKTELASWPGSTNFSPIAIFNNTQDWDESTVVFTNAPTYAATAAETVDHFGTTNAPVYFTGTNTIIAGTTGWLEFQGAGAVALVQGWADGSIPNYGISLWGTGDFVSDQRTFRLQTKENIDPAVHSEIIIKYVVSSGYAGWASGWGVDIGAETDDYDADGLSNLYEFGLGGDPTNALDQGTSPTFGIADVGGTNWFGYIYPQLSDPESGLAYSLELSTDLVLGTWTNDGYAVVGTNVTGEVLDFVTNVTDTADNEKFIRLIIQ